MPSSSQIKLLPEGSVALGSCPGQVRVQLPVYIRFEKDWAKTLQKPSCDGRVQLAKGSKSFNKSHSTIERLFSVNSIGDGTCTCSTHRLVQNTLMRSFFFTRQTRWSGSLKERAPGTGCSILINLIDSIQNPAKHLGTGRSLAPLSIFIDDCQMHGVKTKTCQVRTYTFQLSE